MALDENMRVTVKIGELMDYLKAIRESGAACGVYIESQPGVGKTQTVHAFGDAVGLPVYDFRTAIRQPVDVMGVPSITDGRTVFNPPAELMDNPFIFFLDEMPNGTQAMQNALLQLPCEHRLGHWNLPDGSMVIAAGNRVEDKAGAVKMISNMRDRFIWLEVEPNVEDWCSWAIGAGISHELTAFMRWAYYHGDAEDGAQNYLFDFDPQRKINPSPRSWANVDALCKSAPVAMWQTLIAGCVGLQAAVAYLAFRRVFNKLPDPRTVLAAPDTAMVPKHNEPDVLYALTGALATHSNGNNAAALLTYMDRLPGEFAALLWRDCCGRDAYNMANGVDLFSNTMAYNQYASAHPELTGAV